MELQTTRFGAIDAAEDSIITFTQPIIGFQEFRRFVFLPGPNPNVSWLQSTDSGELAFLLMDPRSVVQDYRVRLGDHELTELAVSAVDELDIYTLVVVPPDPTKVRTNLKAPILVNSKLRLAKQTILDKSSYPVQFVLSEAQQGTSGPKEASNASADS